MALSDAVGGLIRQARRDGELRGDLGEEFVLFTIYARSCDPTMDFLKATGTLSDEQIVEQMVSACFDGIGAQGPAATSDGARR